MKLCKTQLSEIEVIQIKQSGKSVYQFLQEAVREKLENQNSISVHSMIHEELIEIRKGFDSFKTNTESSLLKTIEIVLEETKKMNQNRQELEDKLISTREITKSTLNKINTKLETIGAST